MEILRNATKPRVPQPPGFLSRVGGVVEVHAAFLNESRTRDPVSCCVAGNPGSFAPFAKGGIHESLHPPSPIRPSPKNAKWGATPLRPVP
jgi:hypothetical protein